MNLLISFIAAIALVGVVFAFIASCGLACAVGAVMPVTLFILLILLILFTYLFNKILNSNSAEFKVIALMFFGIGLVILLVVAMVVLKIDPSRFHIKFPYFGFIYGWMYR